jgi:hypothetical protein
MSLVEAFADLNIWLWAAVLAGAGLLTLLIWLTERADLSLLITAYALFAVSGLLAGLELNILADEVVAAYVMGAIALPFILTWLLDRSRWWALIPAYVMVAIGVMVLLTGYRILADEAVATYVLSAIALPFLIAYLLNRSRWPFLIPAYVLLAVGVMVGLIGLGVLDDLLIPAYVMLAIALPFYVVYILNRDNWWALIPAGIMTVVALSFLVAEELTQYVLPAMLILIGIWVLARQFGGGDRQPDAPVEVAAPEGKAPEIKVASQESTESQSDQ